MRRCAGLTTPTGASLEELTSDFGGGVSSILRRFLGSTIDISLPELSLEEVLGRTYAEAALGPSSIDTVADAVQNERPDLGHHAAPDGTVTVVFTDIEASTVVSERLGDKRWMDLLHEHNAVVREQLSAHGGYEVKTEGDGFMVAFSLLAQFSHTCAL